MPDRNTKERIIFTCIDFFNELGVSNVPLQMVAKEVGISPGNLAYHFRNKEAIVEAVCKEAHTALNNVLSEYRRYPTLVDFDKQLSMLYSFMREFRFYFVDTLEIRRNYEAVWSSQQRQFTKLVNQINKRFDYNQKREIVKKEPIQGHYMNVSYTMWLLINQWPVLSSVRDKGIETSAEDEFKSMIWSQVIPFLTDLGVEEYENLVSPIHFKEKSL